MPETRMELHWGRVTRCYVERPPTLDAMFRQAVGSDAEAVAVVDGPTKQHRGRIYFLDNRQSVTQTRDHRQQNLCHTSSFSTV